MMSPFDYRFASIRLGINLGINLGANIASLGPELPENAISIFSEMVPAEANAYIEDHYYTLSTKFRFTVPGSIYGIRFYLDENDANSRSVVLHEAGVPAYLYLGTAPVTNEEGWVDVVFAEPIEIEVGTYYLACVACVDKSNPAKYYATSFFFDTEYASAGGEVVAVANSESVNGMFADGILGIPNTTYNSTFYWIDVIFVPA